MISPNPVTKGCGIFSSILAHSSRAKFHTVKMSWQQGLEVADYTRSSVRKHRENKFGSVYFLNLIQFRSPIHGILLPVFRVDLPTSIQPRIPIPSPRHSQSFVFKVILAPVKLAMFTTYTSLWGLVSVYDLNLSFSLLPWWFIYSYVLLHKVPVLPLSASASLTGTSFLWVKACFTLLFTPPVWDKALLTR